LRTAAFSGPVVFLHFRNISPKDLPSSGRSDDAGPKLLDYHNSSAQMLSSHTCRTVGTSTSRQSSEVQTSVFARKLFKGAISGKFLICLFCVCRFRKLK
jgi:hypothetical protein